MNMQLSKIDVVQKQEPKIVVMSEDSEDTKELSDYDKFQQKFAKIIEERTEHNSEYINKTGWIDRNDDGSYDIFEGYGFSHGIFFNRG
jgi:hypothetical protein